MDTGLRRYDGSFMKCVCGIFIYAVFKQYHRKSRGTNSRPQRLTRKEEFGSARNA
jgi:hypothetical protein